MLGFLIVRADDAAKGTESDTRDSEEDKGSGTGVGNADKDLVGTDTGTVAEGTGHGDNIAAEVEVG
jgi:hypothetical protein